MDGETRFDIVLDGGDAAPATTPVDALVGLANAYFVALKKVAEQNGIELGPFVGIEIGGGSFRFGALRAPPETRRTRGLLHAQMRTPGAAEQDHLRNLANATLKFPPGWRALALLPGETKDDAEALIPTTAAKRDSFREVTARRLMIVGLDATPPKIKVFDRRHEREYWLTCDTSVLSEAAAALSKTVEGNSLPVADIKVDLERDLATRKIASGRILRFQLVDEEWSVDGLLAWFAANFQPDPA